MFVGNMLCFSRYCWQAPPSAWELLADCPMIPHEWKKGWSMMEQIQNRVHVQNTGFQHDHSSYTFTIYRRFEQSWSIILGNYSGNTQTWWPDNNTKLQRFGFESLTRWLATHKDWHLQTSLQKNEWQSYTCQLIYHQLSHDVQLLSLIFVPLLQTPTVLDQCLSRAARCWAIVATFHSYSPQFLGQIQQWLGSSTWCFTRRDWHRVSSTMRPHVSPCFFKIGTPITKTVMRESGLNIANVPGTQYIQKHC